MSNICVRITELFNKKTFYNIRITAKIRVHMELNKLKLIGFCYI